MTEGELIRLGLLIGHPFKNAKLLEQAVTHRSKCSSFVVNNERLEFLGDRVLDLVVSDILYKKFPEVSEGILSKFRSTIVNNDTLSKVGDSIDLGDYIIAGNGQLNDGIPPKLVANTVEAIIGAIYLDSAFPLLSCKDFVEKHFTQYIPDIPSKTIFNDYKSALQEYLAKCGNKGIYYEFKSTGPDHEKEYTCTTRWNNGDPLCDGFGHSKKSASQEAARKTLALLQSN